MEIPSPRLEPRLPEHGAACWPLLERTVGMIVLETCRGCARRGDLGLPWGPCATPGEPRGWGLFCPQKPAGHGSPGWATGCGGHSAPGLRWAHCSSRRSWVREGTPVGRSVSADVPQPAGDTLSTRASAPSRGLQRPQGQVGARWGPCGGPAGVLHSGVSKSGIRKARSSSHLGASAAPTPP